jgi:hypothetical protein
MLSDGSAEPSKVEKSTNRTPMRHTLPACQMCCFEMTLLRTRSRFEQTDIDMYIDMYEDRYGVEDGEMRSREELAETYGCDPHGRRPAIHSFYDRNRKEPCGHRKNALRPIDKLSANRS